MSLVQQYRIGFGAATMGNLYRPMDDQTAHDCLETAWQAGVRYFDTAPHYGLGLSERRLGAFLQTKPRDEFIISTKVGRLLVPNEHPTGDDMAHTFAVPDTLRRQFDNSASGIARSLDESLERLGLDRVDVLLLHDPEEAPEGTDAALASGLEALRGLRDQGRAQAIGVGSKSVPALQAAVSTGVLDVVMVSGRFTLLEQPAAAELLPSCLDHGVDAIAVSVFNSGLLARPRPASDATYEYGRAADDLVARANAIADVCARFGTTLPEAALAFPLRHRPICSELLSGSSPEQVRQTAERASARIDPVFWPALAESGLVPAELC